MRDLETRDSKASVLINTLKHKDAVTKYAKKLMDRLWDRCFEHDASKTQEPELSVFAEYGPKLSKLKYGSEEYNENLVHMKEALKNHYGSNRHHPEHFENGMDDMNLVDLLEMFCDWRAATDRTQSNFKDSLETSIKRFKIEPQLASILRNTIDIMG